MAEALSETKVCTNCKKKVAKDNYQMHELHCIRHMKLCPKCNEPVNKNAMQEHMETEHKEIKCPACGMKVYEKQLTQHQNENCSHRSAHCFYCDLDYPKADLANHQAVCGTRTDKCRLCSKVVMLCNMEKHEASGCLNFTTSSLPKVQNTLANRSNPTPAGSLLPKINNRQRSQPTSDPDEEASLRLALELTQDEERLRMYNGIDRSPDPNAGRTLDEQTIACEFCGVRKPLSHIVQHEIVCQDRHPPVGNTLSTSFSTMTETTPAVIDDTISVCPTCQFPMSPSEISLHQLVCTGQPLSPPYEGLCPYCNLAINMADMPSHLQLCQLGDVVAAPAVEDPYRLTDCPLTYHHSHTSGLEDIMSQLNVSRGETQPELPAAQAIVTFPEDDVLPCEFCQAEFPSDMLTQHQFTCSSNNVRMVTPWPEDHELLGIEELPSPGPTRSRSPSTRYGNPGRVDRNRGFEKCMAASKTINRRK